MKHLRKYNESEQIDIASDRVEEINKQLKDFISIMDEKSKYVDSLINELDDYKSSSMRSNDQIDDSIAALQVMKKDIDDCMDKIDTVVNNLEDYNSSGRKFLYTENK